VTSLSSFWGEALGHIATPLEGKSSWVTRDGRPADPRVPGHYPIFARCKACHEPIWLASQLQMEWWHVDARQVIPAADAP
jgi:hypothetical protein